MLVGKKNFDDHVIESDCFGVSIIWLFRLENFVWNVDDGDGDRDDDDDDEFEFLNFISQCF